MSDPRRLLRDGPSSLEADLLRSVAAERPTLEQRARVRQAMGIAPGGSIPPAAPSGWAAGGKIAIAGLVAAGAIAALLARGTFRAPAVDAPAPANAVQTPTPVAEPAAIAAEPLAAEPQILPSAGATPSPIPRATAITPSRPAREPKSNAAETSSASDIKDQIRLIDEAHAAVSRRDPASALRAVDTYASKYPGGAFGQEAMVIRIEALDQNGNHARAASLARSFLAKHPASAHARRLERIAGN